MLKVPCQSRKLESRQARPTTTNSKVYKGFWSRTFINCFLQMDYTCFHARAEHESRSPEVSRSEGHGDAFLSYSCKEVRVHVSFATTWEHCDNHLPFVLFSWCHLKYYFVEKVSKQRWERNGGRIQLEKLVWWSRFQSEELEFAIAQTFRQAAKFAPDDMPASRPSSLANLLAFSIASSAVTVMISSTREVSKFLGTNPGPTPWILCREGLPPITK